MLNCTGAVMFLLNGIVIYSKICFTLIKNLLHVKVIIRILHD